MCRFRSRRKNACMHAGTEPGYPSIYRLVMILLRINHTVFGTLYISIANCNFTMVGSGCFHNRFSSTEAKLFSRGPTPLPPETNWIVVDSIVSIPISGTSTISRKIISTPQSTPLPQAGDQTIGDLLNDVYIDLAERGWSERLQLIRSLDPLGGGEARMIAFQTWVDVPHSPRAHVPENISKFGYVHWKQQNMGDQNSSVTDPLHVNRPFCILPRPLLEIILVMLSPNPLIPQREMSRILFMG